MKRFFSIILIGFFVFPLLFPLQKIQAASNSDIAANAQKMLDDWSADYLANDYADQDAIPTVTLAFNPTGPADGNKVQAFTTTTNFKTGNSNLYYTWFLKRDNCPKDKSECDLNEDGKVNIEDYKIEAARIIANGGFDWKSANYSKREGSISYDIEGNNEDRDSDSKSGYDASMGGDGQSSSKCYIRDFDGAMNYRLKDCAHLFPKDNVSGESLGDGSFSLKEEKFWHTNPNDVDTAATGNTDEANVIGLGQESFVWTYKTGDKVGVAVEGLATGTDHVMWALPKNKCNTDKFQKDGDFTMEVSDVNACLEKNMVSVKEGTDSSVLVPDESADENENASLTYLPSNPSNDPSGNNPTRITLTASVLDTLDKSRVYYNWKVYGSNEKDPEDWGDPLLKSKLVNSSSSAGFGLDEFSFDLAFSDSDIKYIKVKVSISENDTDGNTEATFKEVVIPIASAGTMGIYSVSANPDSSPGDILTLEEERCKNTTEDCSVAKNEIVGVKINSSNLTDFSWKLDDETLIYPVCPLADCSSPENNSAFFPILKNKGEKYTLSVSAIDKKTKEVVSLTKNFLVTDPYAFITSDDKKTCAPVLLGYFIDLDNNLSPDYSTTNFQALPGSTIKLNPNLSVPNLNNLTWTVDATTINKDTDSQCGVQIDDKGVITFPADTEVGYSFDVKLSALYTQDNNIKKTLNKYWGVALNDFYEKQIDATITIDIVDELETADATDSLSQKNDRSKLLAAMISSAPTQFIFLVKIVLISFLLLFSSYFLLSLFPKKDNA